MSIPLHLAVPAAVAGLAYIDAKLSLSYDFRLLGSAFRAEFRNAQRLKRDRLNAFYTLEDHALGKIGNDVFIIFEGKQWTYKQVYDIALKFGTWFKTVHNVKPKEIVAMDYMNSEKFVFIWLGLWSIGAKPAFINYNLSGKALAHCIRVSTARLIIIDPEIQDNVTQEVRDELSSVEFQVFTPDVEAVVMSTQGVREPDHVRSEDLAANIATLIYTSGTTGLPKPAIVSWRKINIGANHVASFSSYHRPDIFYTCMPLYHSSAGVLGFCTTLHEGATIVIGKKFSTKTFWKEVRESKATVIQYVGETCRYLLTAPPQIDPVTGEDLDKKNDVRLALGNGLRPDIWNRFKERFGIEAISEFYSATESSSGSWNYSRNDFSKGAIGRNGALSYYLLLRKSCAIVELDHETETPYRDPVTGFCKKVKTGEPGEMLYWLDPNDIGRLFQGYFNNQGSTTGKIMRDVFVKGDAYFRTGDLISWDTERSYFNDRIGDTFRWKSENVSTNEVAEALGSHPHVHEANVYGVQLPHHDGRAGCVAIVLGREPDAHLLNSIAQHVQSALPKFAVPLFLRLTKQMQITGTIKHQKHAIRNEGVDPAKVGDDELFWLKGGTYVKFDQKDWEELNGGRVRL